MTRLRVPFKRIGLAEAQTLALDPEACILDVRHTEDFLRAHIPGAQKISIANLSTVLGTTPKRLPILIYCYHGHASQEYAQIFSDFGFLAVYSLDGGFEAWSHAPRAHHRVQNDLLDQWLGHQGLPTGNGTTPLMRAAHNGRADIIALLIADGAPLDAINNDGNNALWLACAGGHPGAITALIAAGIAIDHQNDNSATALMYAASVGKTNVVALLLQAGAETTLETLDGFTALDMAANVECLTLLRRATHPPARAQAR
jgi:thiosulfate/3-mercaptopyruvate sulfurtransferase